MVRDIDLPVHPIHGATDATPAEFTSERCTSNTGSQFAARLPKLDVPVSSRDSLGWQSFLDCFEAAIHLNPCLTGVQELSYLRAQLSDEAARVIAGLPLTNSNYQHSISLLKSDTNNHTNSSTPVCKLSLTSQTRPTT